MTMINGMHVEIRAAIEPWNVLGEESGSQGTSRYVILHLKDYKSKSKISMKRDM
jgi:uncharacterized protein (DUF2126 family)